MSPEKWQRKDDIKGIKAPTKAFIVYEGCSDGEDVIIEKRSGRKFRKNFVLGMADGYMILSQLDLTASQYQILLLLMAKSDYENYCYVTQSFISSITGISQPNISKHINRMISMGLLFKEVMPNGKALRINMLIMWKGRKSKNYEDRLEADSKCLKLPDKLLLSSPNSDKVIELNKFSSDKIKIIDIAHNL